jgi:hypothetical protein
MEKVSFLVSYRDVSGRRVPLAAYPAMCADEAIDEHVRRVKTLLHPDAVVPSSRLRFGLEASVFK